MKFRATSPNRAISEDGRYEIRGAMNNAGMKFYNAWCGDKHIGASYDKAAVKSVCEAHAGLQSELGRSGP